MRTNEVCDELNMTKKTIYYYEDCHLISPKRDTNGYRDFSSRDIQCLRFIQTLRNMDISIEEIKAIFNDQLSFIDCLEKQKENINQQIDNLLEISLDIEELLQRKPIYYIYKEIKENKQSMNIFFYSQNNINYEKEDYLLFNNEEIIYKHRNDIEHLTYDSIKKVKLSMCSRLQNTGQTILHLNQPLYAFGNNYGGPYVFYYLDLDLYINNMFYKFEGRSFEDIDKIVQLLYKKVNDIEDPINLYAFFKKYTTKDEQYKKINIFFKDWAKKYHLDNPRKVDENQIQNYIKQLKNNQ